MDVALYRRARAADYPARAAIAIARQPREAWPLSWTEDGFIVEATDRPDASGYSLEDIGYGRFLPGIARWDMPDYTERPHPDAVRNNNRDRRNPSGGDGWYLPQTPIRALARWYNGSGGYAKGPAWDKAREDVDRELSIVTTDYGPDLRIVIVTASRNGIELGRSTLGAVEVGYDSVMRSESAYLAEVAHDLAREALDEARKALTALLEGIA